MKRAKPRIGFARSFEGDSLADEIDEIDPITDFVSLVSHSGSLQLPAGHNDARYNVGLIVAQPRQPEGAFVTDEIANHDDIVTDLVSIGRAVLLDNGGERIAIADPPPSLHLGIVHPDGLDLYDTVAPVENKTVSASGTSVDPPRVVDPVRVGLSPSDSTPGSGSTARSARSACGRWHVGRALAASGACFRRALQAKHLVTEAEIVGPNGEGFVGSTPTSSATTGSTAASEGRAACGTAAGRPDRAAFGTNRLDLDRRTVFGYDGLPGIEQADTDKPGLGKVRCAGPTLSDSAHRHGGESEDA